MNALPTICERHSELVSRFEAIEKRIAALLLLCGFSAGDRIVDLLRSVL